MVNHKEEAGIVEEVEGVVLATAEGLVADIKTMKQGPNILRENKIRCKVNSKVGVVDITLLGDVEDIDLIVAEVVMDPIAAAVVRAPIAAAAAVVRAPIVVEVAIVPIVVAISLTAGITLVTEVEVAMPNSNNPRPMHKVQQWWGEWMRIVPFVCCGMGDCPPETI